MNRHGEHVNSENHLLFRALSSESFQSELNTRLVGKRLYAFRSIASTNDFARRLGRNKEPEGSVVVAERQTRGRGRQGRLWHSPPGLGLWLSVLLRPRIEASVVGVVPLFAGVCVSEAVSETTGLSALLKWPNDVLLGERKFCGILSESEFRHDRLDFVVIGIGINVNQTAEDFPAEIREEATSLRLQLGRSVDRLALLMTLLRVLDRNYSRAQAEGFGTFLERWKSRCPHIGKPVTLVQADRTYHGTLSDIAADGSLLLETADGLRSFSAGEVSLRSD